MPRIYPESMPEIIDGQTTPEAERKVYEAFRHQLGTDYIVFYHVSWLLRPVGGAPLDGETDFVVAHPKLGVLLVEVKGGGVGRDARTGKWHSIDRADRRHTIADPFKQATVCKHALVSKIKDLPAWKDRWIDVGHAVLFADLPRPNDSLGIDTSREIVGFHEDLRRIGFWIDEAMKFWRSEHGTRRELGADGVSMLVDLLAKSFELRSPLALDIDEDDRKILELTKAQFHVFDTLSRARRVGICGGAGTGKTVLALEKAQRLAREGFRTLLTCFNRPLGEHLRAQSVAYGNLTVYNFHQLCEILGRKAGCKVLEKGGPMPPQEYFMETLPGFLLTAIEKHPGERFDAIVVDEGQDFADDWWTALQLSLKDPDFGILYVFYDDNQRIYRRPRTFPKFELTVPLFENLRNTKPIHAVASRFYDGELKAAGPSGRVVKYSEAVGPDEIRAKTSAIVSKLLKDDRVTPADIVILSGHSKEKTRLLDEKRDKVGDVEVTFDYLTPKAGRVLFDSIHRFKGLERKVVVLSEIDHLPRLENGDELLYVGLTRARTELFVVGSAETIKRISEG